MRYRPPCRFVAALCVVASAFTLTAGASTLAAQSGTSQPAHKGILEPVSYTEDLDLLDVFFVTAETGWVAGDGGTILRTRDGGTTWEAQVGGDPASRDEKVRLLYFFDEHRGWALQGRKLLHTSDGEGWEEIGTLPYTAAAIAFTSPSNGYLAAAADIYARMPNVIYRTTDGGRTWDAAWPCSAKVAIGGLSRELGCHVTQLQFVSPQVGYATARNNCSGAGCEPPPLIVKTTDGGNSWQVMPGPGVADEDNVSSIFFVDERTGFARLRSRKLHMTTDGGESWRGIVASPGATIRFADPEVGWGVELGRSDLRWSYTTNGGHRWTSRELKLPAVTRGFSMPRRDRAYIVGDHGMVLRYRVVPADHPLGPNDKAAPAMPAFEAALDEQVAQLETVVGELAATLGATPSAAAGAGSDTPAGAPVIAVDSATTGDEPLDAALPPPSEFTTACCAKSFNRLEVVLGALSQSLPEFIGKYRNLNMLAVALRMSGELPDEYRAVKAGLRAFRAAGDRESASASLADVSAAIGALKQTMTPGSTPRPQEEP